MQKPFHTAAVCACDPGVIPQNPPGSQGMQECTQLLPLSHHHLPLRQRKLQTYRQQVSVPPVLLNKETLRQECRQYPKQIRCLQSPL